MAESEYFEIYYLSDPRTDAVRYVGKANNSSERLKGHIRDSYRRHTAVYGWIQELLALGMVPIVSVVESGIGRWQEREKVHIAKMRCEVADLLNLSVGGNEPYCDATTRKANGRKVAIAVHSNQRMKHIWELKQRMGKCLKDGVVSESAKENLRYAARKRPDLFGLWAGV
jgi:hypothetical protein